MECYVCKSDENPDRCSSTSKSPPSVQVSNCSDINTLVNDWITNNDFMKYSVGELNLEKVFNFVGDETTHLSDLRKTTACVYFHVSSENTVTAEVDKSVAKVRSFFGDSRANEPLTVQEWVMRDCVTIKLRQETKDAVADRCFTIPGTQKVAKLYLCTCTSDKCNLPNEQVQRTIREQFETTTATSGTQSCFQNLPKLTFATGILWTLTQMAAN